MGSCDPEKSHEAEEATPAEEVMPASHPPKQNTPQKVVQTESTKGTNPSPCHCEICRHEAKMKTLINIEPPTDANRMVTTCQISYGKGHPQYRSLMAALFGKPTEESGALGPEPLAYTLVRPLCPSVDPGQATCHPYIPSVCPGPVNERFGPFPGLTEFQDTISSNAMRIWLSSQQIRAARPPTCICPPDAKTGGQPTCCQPEGKATAVC